jgi:hypothetical protein
MIHERNRMPNNRRTQTGARGSFHLIAAAVLAVTTLACANGPATAVSPSGTGAASLDVKGGAVKAFTVAISPLSVAAGPASLTVTVTNDLSTNPASLSLGSVRIVVPDGLVVTGVNGFSGSRTWNSGWSTGQVVLVGASMGTQKLAPGESVTFHIDVDARSCGVNAFAKPAGSSETLGGAFSADWTPISAAPGVTVTDCVLEECPAAPAIAGDYLRNQLGMHPNDDPYKNIVAQVADHMTQGAAFDGILPCEPGYGAAVIAFVSAIVN